MLIIASAALLLVLFQICNVCKALVVDTVLEVSFKDLLMLSAQWPGKFMTFSRALWMAAVRGKSLSATWSALLLGRKSSHRGLMIEQGSHKCVLEFMKASDAMVRNNKLRYLKHFISSECLSLMFEYLNGCVYRRFMCKKICYFALYLDACTIM